MIKKRACLEFVYKVENKAIQSVRDKYNKKIEEEKRRILDEGGYLKKLRKVQKDFNKLFDEFSNLALEMKDNKEVNYSIGNYDTFEHETNCFTSKQLIEKTIYKCDFSGGSVELIRNNRDKEIAAVKDNYNKVRIVCERKSNGAQAAEYLKGLGFDISSLEKDESKALSVKIDKSKLFVCGENK